MSSLGFPRSDGLASLDSGVVEDVFEREQERRSEDRLGHFGCDAWK